MGLIEKGKETNLQVIVKAQSYYLEPGMTYSGRWHLEGHTENIVGVGVYYCQVDSGEFIFHDILTRKIELKGGNVKFRPDSAPSPYYAEMSDIITSSEATVQQGAALVFANYIPHRFRKITNVDTKPHRRTFINFFIVDPTKPLKSTKDVPASDFLRLVLSTSVKRQLGKRLPSEVASQILSYIPGVWSSIVQAKKFRAQAREAMLKEKTGWGWINWVFCFILQHLKVGKLWNCGVCELFVYC